jgi:hypothetical protein
MVRVPDRRALLVVACLAALSCASSGPPAADAPTPPTEASAEPTVGLSSRIPAVEQAALLRLAARNQPLEHPDPEPTLAVSLTDVDQARFDAQLAAATDAAARFSTTETAAAAGYVQSATQLPGVGTHWVKWSLVDAPFDPAQPSMLLFDQSSLHETRLAGLSYWVRSDGAPDGFIGPNDHWHQHSGMCFQDGWLRREGVGSAEQCAGQWLAGGDLWMLHVWVAPIYPSSDGVFAPRNASLCPPYWQQLPDALKCASPGDAPLVGSHDDLAVAKPDVSAYCHIPAT